MTILSKIDRDIERISVYLRNLKERRNALIPVFRLPPEIVARIFRILAVDTYIVKKRVIFLGFSQVCRIWRKLALG